MNNNNHGRLQTQNPVDNNNHHESLAQPHQPLVFMGASFAATNSQEHAQETHAEQAQVSPFEMQSLNDELSVQNYRQDHPDYED